MPGRLSATPKRGKLPSGNASTPGSQAQKDITAAAAHKYGLNPAHLWGVYGTESSFGTNRRNSGSGPSGGAKGWMQFEDATARKYGVNVNDFASSMFGAAHYLSDLGGRHNIAQALNNYNGNRGGSSTSTSYYRQVMANAQHWTGGNPANISATTNAAQQLNGPLGFIDKATGLVGQPNSGIISNPGGVIPNPLGPLEVLVGLLTDPTKLAGLLAGAFAWWLRLVWKALWDYVIAPPVHKSQRAALYYWEDILSGKKHFGKSGDPYAWSIPATMGFWSLGGYILWGRYGQVSMMNKHRGTPFGRFLRSLFDLGNKGRLHKPKEAKKHTPPKPKPHISGTVIIEIRTVSVARRRPVTVTEGGRQLGRGAQKRSEEQVNQTGTAHTDEKDHHSDHESTEPSKSGGTPQSSSSSHPQEAEGKREPAPA